MEFLLSDNCFKVLSFGRFSLLKPHLYYIVVKWIVFENISNARFSSENVEIKNVCEQFEVNHLGNCVIELA